MFLVYATMSQHAVDGQFHDGMKQIPKYRLPIHSLCSFPLAGRSVFCLQLSRMQVARLTMCLIVYCPDPPDSRRAWSSESLVLYGCHYAWPLPEVNSTTVHDFTIPLSEGRMSP